MIESMACGTPVIAFRSGSAPEVVDDGVTGFLVDGVEAAATAVTRVTKLNRTKVRARFDERFAIERVAEDYLDIYRALPGVRRVAPSIATSHQAELARLGALISRKPSSFPGLQLLGPPQAAPAE
jgi:Glycosyl transferases group 1